MASAALLPVLAIAWFCEREAQRSRRNRHSMAVIFLALQTAFKVAAVLRARLARFPPVTASLGQAWFCVADRPFPAMLRAAEELLYQAKKTGSDTVRSQRFDD